jgi:hypothetical protein
LEFAKVTDAKSALPPLAEKFTLPAPPPAADAVMVLLLNPKVIPLAFAKLILPVLLVLPLAITPWITLCVCALWLVMALCDAVITPLLLMPNVTPLLLTKLTVPLVTVPAEPAKP